MSKYTNKNNNIDDQMEEGELPDDEPVQSTPKQNMKVQKMPEQQSFSNQIIFQTVTDSEIQSEKKKKKIMKDQKLKKNTTANKDRQRGYQKEKSFQKPINRYSQQRDGSPSFNNSNLPLQNNMPIPPNTYLPPHIQQYYPSPQFAYPMMAPAPVPGPYPPYMGSYMHANMPQSYQYNMGIPMIQTGQMIPPQPQKPIQKAYQPQMNPQINPQISSIMNPSMNVPTMNNPMNMHNPYTMNQKPKIPIYNQDYYQHNQIKPSYNQSKRDWNPQKVEVKTPNPVQNLNYNQRNIQIQTYHQNSRRERYEKAEKQEKEEKMVSESTKRKILIQDYKVQLRKHLKVFVAQQQLQILQLLKCLIKQLTDQSKETNQITKNNHNKILKQLQIYCKQSQDKKQCVYKMLQQLQLDSVLMQLKEKPLLNWILKDPQFMKMSQLTKSILQSPLKI